MLCRGLGLILSSVRSCWRVASQAGSAIWKQSQEIFPRIGRSLGDALASDGIYTTEVSFWLPRPLTVAWDPPGLRHPPGHSDACRWSYEKPEDKSIPFDS